MNQKNKAIIFFTGIVLLFLVIVLIIWLVYDYQLHRLDKLTTGTALLSETLFLNPYETN